MSEAILLNKQTVDSLGAECEDLLPKGVATPQEGVGASLWEHLTALLDAIKSGSVWAIWSAVSDIIDHFKNPDHHPVMMATAKAVGIDWKKWADFLKKILEIIIPIIMVW